MRKLIEAAHTEAWEILTEYRDVLDVLAGELLEKETLHRADLAASSRREEAAAADHVRRLRWSVPSDKPPIKTPGELAIERGEEWPKPVPEPAFKAAIAQASQEAAARQDHQNGTNGNGANGIPANGADAARLRRAGRLARARLAPAGQQQPPVQQPQGYWYPPPHWQNPSRRSVSAALSAVSALSAARTSGPAGNRHPRRAERGPGPGSRQPAQRPTDERRLA